MGGAQVVFILTGLFKMKVAAILIGPAGVGLVGLLTNLLLVVSTLVSVGMGHTGTRQIAAAYIQGDAMGTEQKRKALYVITALLALLGALALWLGRYGVAQAVLGDQAFAVEVGWLSTGVALTVAAAGQTAWLTGLRRIGDLARVSIGTGLIATAISVIGLWLWGDQAVLLLVLSTPAVAFLLGHVYAARPGSNTVEAPISVGLVVMEWRKMWPLGLSFMLATLVALGGQLLVRVLVQRELGLEATGLFQASWSIGMTYMGLVLGVMTSDFHPRLVGVIHDKPAAVQLINQQTDLSFLLFAPMLLLLLGAAPWVVQLLYTPEFGPAVEVLRWQLLGDVLKLASFPLGFLLLAAGTGKTYLLAEVLGVVVYVFVVWIGLPIWGLKAAGIGFLMMYVAYLPFVLIAAKSMIGFKFTWARIKQLFILLLCAAIILILAKQSNGIALGMSAVFAIYFAILGLYKIKNRLRDLFL